MEKLFLGIPHYYMSENALSVWKQPIPYRMIPDDILADYITEQLESYGFVSLNKDNILKLDYLLTDFVDTIKEIDEVQLEIYMDHLVVTGEHYLIVKSEDAVLLKLLFGNPYYEDSGKL